MSIKMWSYAPEKCDGDWCPGNCYACKKAAIDEKHVPIEVLMKPLT